MALPLPLSTCVHMRRLLGGAALGHLSGEAVHSVLLLCRGALHGRRRWGPKVSWSTATSKGTTGPHEKTSSQVSVSGVRWGEGEGEEGSGDGLCVAVCM